MKKTLLKLTGTLLFFYASLSFFLLTVWPDTKGIALSLTASVLFFFLFRQSYLSGTVPKPNRNLLYSLPFALPVILLFLYGSLCQFERFYRSKAVIGGHYSLILPLILAGNVLFYLFLLPVFANASEKPHTEDTDCAPSHKERILSFFFCLLTSGCILTLCTKSSFLYPFNDWVDANAFFTVGKSILKGLVPYRDLLEHKGPYVYFFHALTALISEKSFIGVYLAEVFAAAVFLYFVYRTLRMFAGRQVLATLPLLAFFIYAAPAFCHGDSVEEFCLPLFAFCLFLLVRAEKTDTDLTLFQAFLVGLTAGLVFFIKFTLAGLYPGWYLFLVIRLIKKKKLKNLLPLTGMILAGVLVTFLPILLYFGLHHALPDFFRVYFYNNLFTYSDFEKQTSAFGSLLVNLQDGMHFFGVYNYPVQLCVLAGFFWLSFRERPALPLLLLSCFGFAFLFAYAGGSSFRKYYSMGFGVFAIFGILPVSALLTKLRILKKSPASLLRNGIPGLFILLLCTGLSGFFTENRYLLGTPKSEMPQYRFAQTMAETVENQDTSVTLLNYGFQDGGFYTVTGTIPVCPYFCKLNLSLPDSETLPDEIIKNGSADFVVTRDEELSSGNYELCDTAVFFYEYTDHTYYLYKRKGKE